MADIMMKHTCLQHAARPALLTLPLTLHLLINVDHSHEL